jgi:putative MFS transporter
VSPSLSPARSKIDDVVARIERIPISTWHVKARVIIGVATFFDAFDALAIAFVLPVLVPLWKLTAPEAGLLISSGYLGQLVGALVFGWAAQRFGRVKAMVWAVLVFAVIYIEREIRLGRGIHRLHEKFRRRHPREGGAAALG